MKNMETNELHHWKKFTDPRFIGSHDFQPNQELKVVFESVSNEMIELFNGTKNETKSCIVARFKGAKKPLLLNNTNCKIIERNLSTPFVEQWAGKSIILYVVKVRAFGSVVDAVRVKSETK